MKDLLVKMDFQVEMGHLVQKEYVDLKEMVRKEILAHLVILDPKDLMVARVNLEKEGIKLYVLLWNSCLKESKEIRVYLVLMVKLV
jgi:hypothetical protein